MAKTIAFSGAHSTGKTTTLNAIKAGGWPDIYIDTFSASRAAQAEMGLNVAQIVNDKARYQQLQDLILIHKIRNEEKLRSSHYDYVLVDRSPADIYAYSFLWHSRDETRTEEDDNWFQTYQDRLLIMLGNYDRIINFPVVEEVPFVPEDGRADAATRDTHGRLVTGYLILNARMKTHHLQAVSLGERVNEVLDVLETIHV